MPQVRIVPVAGRLTLNPSRNYQPVPAEGYTVELNPFWTRALNDGDVRLETDVEAAARTAPPAAPQEATVTLSPKSAKFASDEFSTTVK